MKISNHTVLTVCLLACATAPQISAQTEAAPSVARLKEQAPSLNSVGTATSTTPELREKTRNTLIAHRNRMRTALQSELDALRNYQQARGNELLPTESKAVTDAIAKLENNLRVLGEDTQPSAPVTANSPNHGPASTPPLFHRGKCKPSQPSDFCLGAPTHKATDQPLELVLGWGEPLGQTKIPVKNPLQKYHLQVSGDESFTTFIVDVDVAPSQDAAGGDFTLKKKHKLIPGHTYYWRVRADFADGTSSWAQNGVYYFTTGLNIFKALSAKGFHLQKALAGPEAGELAQFGFLNTIGEKTVFSSKFALRWAPERERDSDPGRTDKAWGWSVEGALASDESEAEDAWRFRLSGIFVTDLIGCKVEGQGCPVDQLTDPTFQALYYTGSLKFEGDKDFDVRKLSGEFLITPNSHALAMGTAYPGSPSKPLQFQWRPLFSLDAGHTFRRSVSEERENTILRLVPRVRARVDLQFLRQWLNMNEVFIYADNTFYYLPLEKQRKRNNFLTSGIEFNFTPNLGFGLTYENGRSAPKFERINTLQGIVGIRF